MSVVAVVWDYEREVRQGAVRFVDGELRERDDVVLVDVGEVCKRVVTLDVLLDVTARVPCV